MAVSPTRTQAIDMVADVIRLLDGALVGIGSVPADLQTLIAGLISDFPQVHTDAAAAFRARLASALVAQARAATDPALINFVRTQDLSRATDLDEVISVLYDDLVAAGETIQSRGITYGPAVPGGGNVGTGVIYRLTVDSQGYDLEATHLDTKRWTVVADQATGAIKHREQFRVEGQRPGVDAIEILGSGGLLESQETRSKVSSDSVLANCGFDSFNLGSASFTAGVAALAGDSVVTAWELLDPGGASDPTLFDLVQLDVNQARDLQGVASPTSLRMRALSRIRQFFSVNNVSLDLAVPLGIVLHVYKDNAADGDLVVTWGNKTQTFSVAGLVNASWNRVVVDLDQDLWPASFNTQDPFFQIEWQNRTVGEIYLDELEALVPMVGFDGLWFHPSGGVGLTGTPASVAGKWVEGDEVSFSDSLTATDSQLQQWLFRLYGRHLPHSGTPTAAWAEPF